MPQKPGKTEVSLSIKTEVFTNSGIFEKRLGCMCLTTPQSYKITDAINFDKIVDKRLPFYITKAYLIYTKSIMVQLGGTSEFSEQACEIVLWNDKKEEEIGRLTYKTPILNICVRKDQ